MGFAIGKMLVVIKVPLAAINVAAATLKKAVEVVVTLPKTTKDVREMLSSGCMFKHLQELLLKAACGKDYVSELQFVTIFYGEDINSSVLLVQLELFNIYLNSKEFNNDDSFTIL